MEPLLKRRRLAPKAPEPASQMPSQLPCTPTTQSFCPERVSHTAPAPETTPGTATIPAAERHDFEAFARHLQDAAMFILRQTQKSPYTDVCVLMLRWEEDTSVERDLVSLERIFQERYNFTTTKWYIPTVPNPSIKLGVQMASFLEQASPDQLLIIYYAGHDYLGPDNQLYWACNTKDDAAKLKWDGVRCLFEDAQSDILLLLDSCVVKDSTLTGSHGVKKAIAAYSPDQSSRDRTHRSFTAMLAESLDKLSTGRPFTVERLYEDILLSTQRQEDMQTSLVNGASKSASSRRIPVCLTLTPGKRQSLNLAPLPSKKAQAHPQQRPVHLDCQNGGADYEANPISPEAVADLTFDEDRVLVCTTFVGDASPDMTFFNQWLSSVPLAASKITVEGMFFGPPTMLLISMPISVWSVVQHDKVCCFLGYISSHNMIHLYQRLVNSASSIMVEQEIEGTRILSKVREAAVPTAASRRHSISNRCSAGLSDVPLPEQKPHSRDHEEGPSLLRTARKTPPEFDDSKRDVEDSVEVQEAAEQLKALSHVRHSQGDVSAQLVSNIVDVRLREGATLPCDVNDTNGEHQGNMLLSAAGPKQRVRRSLKQTPKQETQCTSCSHAPFKDSSSLRKHIAAVHTRPFPCAFSFAGCASTFGSKNEWKRHISSQHLCLQYYRCSSCPQSTTEGKGNEFNRKDLFTQHLRRMHAPSEIKKALKGDIKIQTAWDLRVKEMQQSCLVTRRLPPQKSACPKPDCYEVFEGPKSWDDWTEHVGRHMERGEAQRLGVDRLLAKWALDEGIIKRTDNGEYRLCSGGNPGDCELNNSSLSTLNQVETDENKHSIIVATSALEAQVTQLE